MAKEKTYLESRNEILKAAEAVSKDLRAALEKDYVNKGQQIPDTITELIKLLTKKK